jgi:hypothetical protein
MNHEQRDLIQRVHDAGIKLKIDGDRLTYRGPKGALTPDLRAALADWKPDLLYEYHERAGILQYDANLPRAEAEDLAANHISAIANQSLPAAVEEYKKP